MPPARIAELLQPFVGSSPHATAGRPSEPATAGEGPAVLSPAQLHHISTYINILLRWNARINLTALCDPEEIVTRHFGESLFAARHLFPPPGQVATPACPEQSRRACLPGPGSEQQGEDKHSPAGLAV